MNRSAKALALHTRAVVVLLLVAITGALVAAARRPGVAVPPQLGALPYQVDAWMGAMLPPSTRRQCAFWPPTRI